MKHFFLLVVVIPVTIGSCVSDCILEVNPLEITFQESVNWEFARDNYIAHPTIANCEKMQIVQELYLRNLESHEECVADAHRTAYDLRLKEVNNFEIEDCNMLSIDWENYDFVDIPIDLDEDGIDDFVCEYLITHVAFNWDEGQCKDELTGNERLLISTKVRRLDDDNEVMIYKNRIQFMYTHMKSLYDIQSDQEILSTPADALWTSHGFSAAIRRLESTCDWQEDWVRVTGDNLTHKIALKLVGSGSSRLGYVVLNYDEQTHQVEMLEKKLL